MRTAAYRALRRSGSPSSGCDEFQSRIERVLGDVLRQIGAVPTGRDPSDGCWLFFKTNAREFCIYRSRRFRDTNCEIRDPISGKWELIRAIVYRGQTAAIEKMAAPALTEPRLIDDVLSDLGDLLLQLEW